MEINHFVCDCGWSLFAEVESLKRKHQEATEASQTIAEEAKTALIRAHDQLTASLRAALTTAHSDGQLSKEENENLKQKLFHLQTQLRGQATDQQREIEAWRQKLTEATARNATTVNESLGALEKQFRDSELKRAELAKDFAEQIAQGKACQDAMQGEYERKIAELGTQIEEDYRRRTRLTEEQAGEVIFSGLKNLQNFILKTWSKNF